MGRKFQGKISVDIRDSKADWDAFLDNKAPDDAPNVVSQEYKSAFNFQSGRVVKAIFDVADDHYIDVERKMAAAMARD